MSGKNRKQGLSGNPQRRAAQLRGADALRGADRPRGTDALRELAYRMTGGAPAPWWPESHERVLTRARARQWPSGPVGLEALTCEIVGGELFDCYSEHGGGHGQSPWLAELTRRTAAQVRASLTRGDDDWRRLWPLLCGIALTAPRTPAAPGARTPRLLPDIGFAHETALAEIAAIKDLLTERSPHPAVPSPDYGPRPAGPPLAARDEYGSRFLLAAPFRYGDGEAGDDEEDGDDGEDGEHWYAWDVDACWLDVAKGLGTFGSAREALHRWREAAGPAAAGAELTPCAPGLAGRLLASSLDDGTRGESMRGDEPRDLFAEYYREKRRARELARSPGVLAGQDFTIAWTGHGMSSSPGTPPAMAPAPSPRA